MIPAIVLAGGKSSRMGRTKALLPIAATGETFVERIVNTLVAAGVEDVVLVVGADSDVIRANAPRVAGLRVVDNPDHEKGQLTSLLAGLRTIDRTRAAAVLVTLVDVPLVGVSTVRTLIAAHARQPAPVIRPVMNGRHGHPVIFDRSLFDELARADPARGAKPVVHAHMSEMLEVPVTDEGAFADIDTRADYERIIGPLISG